MICATVYYNAVTRGAEWPINNEYQGSVSCRRQKDPENWDARKHQGGVGNVRGVFLPQPTMSLGKLSQRGPRHIPVGKSILMTFLVVKTLLIGAIFTILMSERSVKIAAGAK